jgi:hypothetical protein
VGTVDDLRTNGVLSGTVYPNCSTGSDPDCNLGGQTITNGSNITTYPSLSVPYGQTCQPQVETCSNGTLSGTNTALTCSVQPPASCTFNGQSIADGTSVTAYSSPSVPYGSTCQQETATCSNGVLPLDSGYTYNSCQVSSPASCSYSGQTIPSGGTVTGYTHSVEPYGQTCQTGTATCTNGTLSATLHAHCTVDSDPNCNLDGQTINNGGTITTYPSSTVPYGQTCQPQVETCTNGTLDGSNTALSCSVQPPASCTFNGQSIADGTSVTAYSSQSVPYGGTCQPETATCSNGVLPLDSGYTYTSCQVGSPASCSYNGQTIASGATVTGYMSSNVPYGQTCQSSTVTCTNGALSGTVYPTCSVGADPDCTLGNQTIPNGGSITTYPSSTVPYGQTCQPQVETCSNGTLSGSNTALSCSVQPPANCVFNGNTVISGGSVTGYFTTSVPYGQTCTSESRVCTNGTLSGSAQYTGCSVNGPASCTFNGQSIADGTSVTAYSSPSVPYGSTCQPETATCSNGVLPLDNGYTYTSCSVAPAPPAAQADMCGMTGTFGTCYCTTNGTSDFAGMIDHTYPLTSQACCSELNNKDLNSGASDFDGCSWNTTSGRESTFKADGVCGNANGGSYSSIGAIVAAGECFNSSSSTPVLSGSTWSWTCTGNSYTYANCSASHP